MARAKIEASTDGDIAVSPGDQFDGRGGRGVEIDMIDWTSGVPRAIARELLDPWRTCPHATMRALGGGACPLGCRAAERPPTFEIALTWSAKAWRMPLAYAPRRAA